MGSAKLLLEYRGIPLVRRAVQAAIGARLGPVALVVGAHADRVESAVRGLGVTIVSNSAWESGLGSSIVAGVASIEGDARISAVIVMLADQPSVNAALLARLASEQQTHGTDAAGCRYGGGPGVPALFTRRLFPRLAALPASSGAKSVLMDPGVKSVLIEFPDGIIDIDTPEDYVQLTREG